MEPSLVFLFALVIRGLYLFEFYKNPFFDLIFSAFDQYCFDKAAGQIASGNIFGPFYSEKYSATYFYFLGVIYSIFGRNFIIIYGIQFLIGAISCVMLYAVSKKLFSRNIALIASLYGALYGPIIFHEGKLLRESIFIFLVIASFYSILRFCERNNYVSAFSAALFSSLAMQTRPNSIFLIPFIFYYLFASLSPSSKENRKGPLAAYFIFFLFISAPLLIRSYIINHRFIFYDDSGFITLALGNSPDYGGWGWGYTPLFQKFLDSGEQSLKGTLLHILNNFSSSPIKFLYLYLRKLFFVCNNWEIPSNVSYYIYRDFSLILSLPISN
ncbi:MAG: glycosyltransferase family 39 protein, partial [Nitrospinae bacterium]|nr:glycosyltransferase family 39 protein [Nitrospinota bacterium]